MRTLQFVGCLLACHMATADGGVITGTATTFSGSPAAVTVTVDDQASGAGKLQITVDVHTDVSIGDLRGLFFHLADESLLTFGSFQVSQLGVAVTQQVYGPADSVTNLGFGNNLNGGGSGGPFDIAFGIGTPGIGWDDYQSVTFTLSHSAVDLDTSLFAEQTFGVRMTSVGSEGNRDGSSKLVGKFGSLPLPEPIPSPNPGPVISTPEPATLAIWSIMGVCGLGAARRKRR